MVVRRIHLILFCCAVLAAAAYQYVDGLTRFLGFQQTTDFYKFYLSALRAGNGLPPYWLSSPHNGGHDSCGSGNPSSIGVEAAALACIHPNLNPPFFLVFVLPFVHLNYAVAYVLWCIFQILCLAGGVSILVRELDGRFLLHRFAIVFALQLCYFPTYAGVMLGQIAPMLTLLMIIAWMCERRGAQNRSAFMWAILAGIKPFMYLFAIPILFKGRLSAIMAYLSGVVFTALVGFWVVGLSGYEGYLSAVRNVGWINVDWNASLMGVMSRVFVGGDGVPYWNQPFVGYGLYFLFAVGGVLYLWHLRHDLRGDVALAILLPLAIFFSPLGWLYYFPMLVISNLILLARARGRLAGYHFLLMLAFFIFTAVPSVLGGSYVAYDSMAVVLDDSRYFVCLLFYVGIVGWIVSRLSKRVQ